MDVTILYFASLADKAQKNQEVLLLSPATTLPELYEQLQADYGFDIEQQRLRVAINDEFASWDSRLIEGDTVAFIPPVAGG